MSDLFLPQKILSAIRSVTFDNPSVNNKIIAGKIGMDASNFSQVLMGKRSIPSKYLYGLAMTLVEYGVNKDYLTGHNTYMYKNKEMTVNEPIAEYNAAKIPYQILKLRGIALEEEKKILETEILKLREKIEYLEKSNLLKEKTIELLVKKSK